MVNQITLIGNVGTDPETVTFDNGGSITTINLATEESWKDDKGEKQSRTTWHRVKFNKGLAVVVQNYVNKGDKLYIQGAYLNRQYDKKDGTKGYEYYVHARNMKMIGSKPATSPQGQSHEAQVINDDLPF